MKYKLHGLKKHPLYSTWCNMKTRCYNPAPHQHHYKNVKVCKEWKDDFKAFYDWCLVNGYDQSLSIDRINSKDDYTPDNCRWVDKTVQARNKSKQLNRTYKGTKLDKRTGKYEARISVNKKYIHLGTYLTEIEAAIAYNSYIINNDSGHSLNMIQ